MSERETFLTVLRILADDVPGAALNAVREDEPEIAALVAEIRRKAKEAMHES